MTDWSKRPPRVESGEVGVKPTTSGHMRGTAKTPPPRVGEPRPLHPDAPQPEANPYPMLRRFVTQGLPAEEAATLENGLRNMFAEAWDEGYAQGIRDQEQDVQHGADNPYRGGAS